MITVENLSKTYGSHEVLKNIHLTFEPGRVYGIVGENGAGKTTLFRCLAGLDSHSGVVRSALGQFKNHLGFLPTDPYFFARITGREYVRLLCNSRNVPVPDLDQANVFDLPLDQYAVTYSTGMKKKLALLAILMQQNEVYILDEPFNGVDIQSNLIITEIIHRLKSLNKTVIISSHIFSTLQDNCDEIRLLRAGAFVRTVLKDEFQQLEAEMKAVTIGNRIERLGLR